MPYGSVGGGSGGLARPPEWDEVAWQHWLRDPSGPVRSELMPRLGADTAARAKATFHRRTGDTAGSIDWVAGSDRRGPYVQIGGKYVIRFLEKPAHQMHRPYRWLSDALREVCAGR